MTAVIRLLITTILSIPSVHASEETNKQINNTNTDYSSSFFDSEFDEQTLISLNSAIEYSDNTYQRSSGEKNGVKSINGFSINYVMGRKENKYAIQYDTNYTNYSEEDIEDKLNWFGKASIYQQILSTNFFIDASILGTAIFLIRVAEIYLVIKEIEIFSVSNLLIVINLLSGMAQDFLMLLSKQNFLIRPSKILKEKHLK